MARARISGDGKANGGGVSRGRRLVSTTYVAHGQGVGWAWEESEHRVRRGVLGSRRERVAVVRSIMVDSSRFWELGCH